MRPVPGPTAALPTSLRAALLAVAVTLAAGCGSSDPPRPRPDAGECLPVGCGPSYQVSFTRTAWPAGKYQVAVTADGVTDSCEIELPLICGRSATCTATANWVPNLSGCALPANQHSISGITFNGDNPKVVEVTVLEGERKVGMAGFTPTYTESEPGGPGCGKCKTGSSTLTLEP